MASVVPKKERIGLLIVVIVVLVGTVIGYGFWQQQQAASNAQTAAAAAATAASNAQYAAILASKAQALSRVTNRLVAEIRHEQRQNTARVQASSLTLRAVLALEREINAGRTPGHGLIVSLCVSLGLTPNCRR